MRALRIYAIIICAIVLRIINLTLLNCSKIAGIGGLDGPKPIAGGGMGAFKVPEKGANKKKKNAPKMVKKTNNNKKPTQEKKANLWVSTPWNRK